MVERERTRLTRRARVRHTEQSISSDHLIPEAVTSQSIRRDERLPPADDVSVILVMRWLDKDELKTTRCTHWFV
jgi:hypothetical protein